MSYNQPPPPPPGGPGGPGGPSSPPPQGGYGAPQFGAPAGGARPGELLNRFLARLIDFVILGVVFGIIFSVLSAIIYTGFTTSFFEYFLVYTLSFVLQAVGYVAYFALLESSRGQTVGKMVLKLRTVGPDGVSNPTLQEAVKRNAFAGLGILGIIPFLGWFFLGWAAPIGAAIFIAITLNSDQPNHQGWHDKFAGGTRVLQVG
ncbi:RDD family protein [Nocardioides sp. SYSU DS0651]|uniref:RDD family protein n=1 Tax=Nocardioides sp. SYSU DS0651 TaxID=3415955 RepID=UPI003F4C921D